MVAAGITVATYLSEDDNGIGDDNFERWLAFCNCFGFRILLVRPFQMTKTVTITV